MAKKEEKNEIKVKKKIFSDRQKRYAIATGLLLLTLLAFSVTFVLHIYLITESSCYDALAIETEDAIAELESNFRNDRTTLRVMAGLIGNVGDLDSMEVSGYLSNYEVNSLITQIGILLPGDELIPTNGHKVSVKGKLSFEAESAQGEHITGVQPSGRNSNATVIRNYVPIKRDGELEGMLFSEASPGSIAKSWIPALYDKKGYCYVVSRKTGEIIINTAPDKIEDINDISFTQTDKAYTREDTIRNILDGKKGYSVFRSEIASENLYMCYLPFSLEDWEMVVFVPESAVFSAVAPITKDIYILLCAVALDLVLYALWLAGEIRRSIADTERRANIDVLTGLQNRNRYEAYIKELEGAKEKTTCLYIDANGLHELNNSKGHYAGDQMLRFIADTLKIQFGNEHTYRIGGDEFVVFQADKSEEEMNKCLERFNEALQRNDYHAAVGTCVYGFGMSVDQLIKNAEKEMYEAKQKYYESIGKVMRV